jgi:apolipoprotein D and lipocalin family protein
MLGREFCFFFTAVQRRDMPHRIAGLLLFLGVAMFGAGCASKPLPPTVSYVDLNRYVGRWYVISHVPYFLERGKVASYDTYTLLPDGKLSNDFTFRPGNFDAPEKTWFGTAEILDAKTNATWKVSFVWPLSVTYKVFALDPDYRWAVVGTKDAGLLWVLARERQLAPTTYATILRELNERGINTSGLAAVPQPSP